MFEMEGVEIDFREDGCRPLLCGRWSGRPALGACVSFLEGILLESMYTIPSQPDVAKIVVDESVVTGDSEPLLVYETPAPAAPAARNKPAADRTSYAGPKSNPVRTSQGITIRLRGP